MLTVLYYWGKNVYVIISTYCSNCEANSLWWCCSWWYMISGETANANCIMLAWLNKRTNKWYTAMWATISFLWRLHIKLNSLYTKSNYQYTLSCTDHMQHSIVSHFIGVGCVPIWYRDSWNGTWIHFTIQLVVLYVFDCWTVCKSSHY